MRRLQARGGACYPNVCAADADAVLTSADGTTEFRLRSCQAGLVVVKSTRGNLLATHEQALLLRDSRQVDRWLNSDPVRFEDPLLYESLRLEASFERPDAEIKAKF